MRARKIFCVISYDIATAKRRREVVKVISPYGIRVNLSVFECMLTAAQLRDVVSKLHSLVKKGKDQIAIYRICLDCFGKAEYIPEVKESAKIVRVLD